MRAALVVLALMSLACAGGGSGKDLGDDEEDRGILEDQDHDDDGYVYTEDCNDEVASINPGAAEVCDPGDVDENCNGLADEADPGVTGGLTAYPDRDADGFGDGATPTPVCAVGGGYVADGTDCDDTDGWVNPAAVEACDEANLDEDCDGGADDADPDADAAGKVEAWFDEDGDGYGVEPEYRCDLGGGWVDQGHDCDDADATVEPSASEWCDGVDNDCDGAVDPSTALNAETWYRDADRDGYGSPGDTRLSCTAPSGYVSTDDDCDDGEASAHPGGEEVCDDADNDCDGAVDVDASDAPTWYRDADSDGYGTGVDTRVQCDAPSGYAANDDDCNDATAAVSPDDTEVCDASNTDEDCDGLADDADSAASGKSTWYRDADGDGYGLSSSTTSACDVPSGYTSNSTDCDDGRAARNPGATEVCDTSNTDEDCDGRADDNDTSVSASSKTTFYLDYDRDGYGASGAVYYCDAPSALHVTADGDCSASDPAVHPGATEVCGGVDDDCDGLTDDADSSLDADEWYLDADGDGYGDDDGTVVAACSRPVGYAAGGDCDDGEPAVHAGATEVCFDGVDDDCDGADECAGATGADATLRLTGTGAYDWTRFGISVEIVGDVDGDGVRDLAVADIYGNEWYGTVDVFSGAATGELTPADRLLTASSTDQSSEFGSAMAVVADVTGDGLPELWVGAYRQDGASTYDVGAAYLLDGADLSRIALLRGRATSDWFGTDFLEVGDVDGDGVDEVLLGGDLTDGPGSTGVAYLVDATVSGEADVEDVADARLYTTGSGAVGGKLCRFGDLDGDGADEIGFSAVSVTNNRTAFVSDIPTGDVDLASEPYFSSSGYTVDCAGGDVDGDGYADAVVFHHTGLEYTASLVLGPVSTTTTVATAQDAIFRPTYEYFPSQIGVTDLDGDGRAEWMIGSTHSVAWGDYEGYGMGFMLGFGGDARGTLSPDHAIFRVGGGRYDDFLGASYALGDLEGDGDPEILVGGIGAALLFRYSEL